MRAEMGSRAAISRRCKHRRCNSPDRLRFASGEPKSEAAAERRREEVVDALYGVARGIGHAFGRLWRGEVVRPLGDLAPLALQRLRDALLMAVHVASGLQLALLVDPGGQIGDVHAYLLVDRHLVVV